MSAINKRKINKAKRVTESKDVNEGYPEWWETTGYTKDELDFSWVLQDNK